MVIMLICCDEKNCNLHVMNMIEREKHIKPGSCPAIIFGKSYVHIGSDGNVARHPRFQMTPI